MPLLIIRTQTTCWNPINFIFFHPSSPRWRRRPTGDGVAQAREPRSRQPPPRLTALLSGGGRSISTHTHSRPSLHFNPSIPNQQQGRSAAAAAPAVKSSNMSELVMMCRQELQHHGRKQHTRVVKKQIYFYIQKFNLCRLSLLPLTTPFSVACAEYLQKSTLMGHGLCNLKTIMMELLDCASSIIVLHFLSLIFVSVAEPGYQSRVFPSSDK